MRLNGWQRIGMATPAIILLLSGCNRADERQRVEANREFQQKVSCERYAWPLEREEMEREKTFGEDTKGWTFTVTRIFYSKTRNSCVAVEMDQDLNKSEMSTQLIVIDALTREQLWSGSYNKDSLKNLANDEKDVIKAWQ